MASKPALSRLRKELKVISADPPPHIHVSCDESNILSWSFLLEGPEDTPYEGGWYWGRLRFPKDYPFAPPSILMVTASGRFETNTRLCLSMSDFHPESWQPTWSVATVLKGLLSFMCEDTPTTGAIDPPPSFMERRRLASLSLDWNRSQMEFMKAFPDVDRIVSEAWERRAKRDGTEPREVPTPGCVDGVVRRWEAGQAVRVSGLRQRADLNGLEGLVQESDDKTLAAGRVCVRVGEETLAVRPENLELPGTDPDDSTCAAPARRFRL
jgi:ubiquitin-conjugating enzyme E2 J2